MSQRIIFTAMAGSAERHLGVLAVLGAASAALADARRQLVAGEPELAAATLATAEGLAVAVAAEQHARGLS